MSRISLMLIPLIGLFFSAFLCAEEIAADYRVEYGIFGQVGKAHAILRSDEKYYMIDANVSALGIAKAVTDDLKERHISKGHISKGFLVTDMYQMIKSFGPYTTTTIYRVDHKKKRLTRQYKKWRYDRLIINKTERLEYYGKDDLMTLFLNLPLHIKDKQRPNKYHFIAVGEDRKNGRVDITIPSKKSLKEIIDFVGKGQEGDWYSRVVMHRKLYHSKQGELDVRIGKEGMVEKAVLKDLIFFGDVRIIKQ
ncbi:hypothetical protein MN086_07225 [Sulfurovum sp. XGS-02]|uniref:hypothetical protein n=1 Tax=Sulfurovum sp. XGS-02 TaxID=2925411 RepID=UPI002065FA53|nr:hypothetical protein [Sulfurovum sp. XGS-02]UPT76844.1 hypothetical protein MN086_07225 [Sulfurovum sp. XGS-02]